MKSHNRNQIFLRAAMAMTQKARNGDIHVSMNVMRWRAGLKKPKKDYTYGLKAEQLVTPAERFAQKVKNGTGTTGRYDFSIDYSGVGWNEAVVYREHGEETMIPGNVLLTWAQWKEMNNDETI